MPLSLLLLLTVSSSALKLPKTRAAVVTSAIVAADDEGPVTTISSAPSGVTGATSATFVFAANEPSTYSCTVDLGTAACSSPAVFTGLSQGPHTFSVTATDLHGNPESSPPSRNWIIWSNANSVTFDGADDVINIGKPADLDLTVGSSTLTFALWFRRGEAGDFERHMGGKARMAGGGQVGVVSGIRADEEIEALVYGGENTHGGNAGGFVHGWHLWSLSINGTTSRLYLDGHQVGSTFTNGSGPWETTASWLIGGNRGGDDIEVWYPFKGDIDEVTFWSAQFNDAEHWELLNGGTPTSPYAHSRAATLLHYYPMGDGDTYPTFTDRKGSSNGTAENMSGSGVIVTRVPLGLDPLPCVAASGCNTQLVANDWDGSSATWTARTGDNATKRATPTADWTANFAGRKYVQFATNSSGACFTIPNDEFSTGAEKRSYEILVDLWPDANSKYLIARTNGGHTQLFNILYKNSEISFASTIYTTGAAGVWLGTEASAYTDTENKPIAWTITMDLAVPRLTVYRNGTQIYQDTTSSGSLTTASGQAVGLGCRWNQSSASTEILDGRVLEFVRHTVELDSSTVSSRLTRFNAVKGY